MVNDVKPPVDLKKIIKKTAQFAAKFGESFEAKVKVKEADNPRFTFLNDNTQYNAYYRRRVSKEKDKLKPTDSTKKQDATTTSTTPASNTSTDQTSTTSTSQSETTSSNIIQPPSNNSPIVDVLQPPPPVVQPEQPKKQITEPPPLYYVLDIPKDMTALELDTIKLTAQYGAKNGDSFLQGLAARESKNSQFDFLKPTHHLHEWFRSLVESYHQIITPPKGIKDLLKGKDFTDKQTILERSINRFEWYQKEEIAKKKAEEEEDQERAVFASIDWHDFVVVEHIDFEEDDLDSLPLPKTFDQLLKLNLDEMESAEQEKEEMDVENDMDMDMEDGDMSNQSQQPDRSKLKVVKDYTKSSKPTNAPAPKKITQICPICQQQVPLDEMQEHMRIELLNRRDRPKVETSSMSSTVSYDEEIAKNLQSFANKRTDLFDADQQDEDDTPQPEKILWDGHTTSIQRTQNAMYLAAQEKQQQQQQQHPHSSHTQPPPPHFTIPGSMTPFGMMPPGSMAPFGVMPPPPPNILIPTNIEEPTLKKQKVDDNLIPEEDWIQNNPPTVNLIVEHTLADGNVQNYNITANIRDTISVFKEKIKDLINMAPNKQKLKAPGISILKDQQTIAFYNLGQGTVISVGAKERGGRKK